MNRMRYEQMSDLPPAESDLSELKKRRASRRKEVLSAEMLAPLPQGNTVPVSTIEESEVDEKTKLLSSQNEWQDKSKAGVKSGSKSLWSMELGSLGYTLIVVGFTILGLATRFYKISSGKFVLWDEAHFGKFGTHYIDGTFYFDVHPPLGKMLVGLAGKLSGYDGGFKFESGQDYPEEIPYVKIRMIIATFGAICVPFSYILSKNLGFSDATSLMVGACTLLEVGLIGISRLILLDSMLLFFGMAVMTFYSAFRRINRDESEHFTARWHLKLLLTGASIGCVSSVKWVGFFITGLVGLMTVEELWKMFGNYKISYKTISKHFFFRALYLIVVPVSIYVFCFFVHFKLLFRSGPGNANMSSLFQAGLEGTDLSKSPLQVAFGSKVTVRSSAYGAGLLHSHVQTYPEGSKQQQITLYVHHDHNNDWVVHRSFKANDGVENEAQKKKLESSFTDEDYQIEFLKDGDEIRLQHKSTGKYLHSHYIGGRVTSTDYEVTGYGWAGHHDPNDLWVVEVEKDIYRGEGRENKIIRSLFTQFRLRHAVTGCYLRATSKTYPEWGFRHGEVSCQPNVKIDGKSRKELLWNVESQENDKLPEGQPGQYKSNFIDDFIEHNIGMLRTNNALVPDSELEPSALTSRPYHWMFLLRGLRMSGFGDDATKFYMLGNPLVWWASAVAVTLLLIIPALYFVLKNRYGGAVQLPEDQEDEFFYRLEMTVGSWAFNYLPFFLMGRVTYVHHYYPALLFAIQSFGFLFEHLTRKLSSKTRAVAASIVVLMAAVVFVHFAPMAYGFTGPVGDFAKTRKLLSSWNL